RQRRGRRARSHSVCGVQRRRAVGAHKVQRVPGARRGPQAARARRRAGPRRARVRRADPLREGPGPRQGRGAARAQVARPARVRPRVPAGHLDAVCHPRDIQRPGLGRVVPEPRRRPPRARPAPQERARNHRPRGPHHRRALHRLHRQAPRGPPAPPDAGGSRSL
ncbi:hypothetical protein H4R21_005720, partial [Coemansia helicoidea]